jgi:hypothetical protein
MPPAADANQANTYLPLIIAAIGILGTLAAAVVTQILSSRRDNKQWLRQKQLQDERFDREREQEALRWERERQERAAQWHREDAARLHEQLLNSYSGLYSRISEMLESARSVNSLPFMSNDNPDASKIIDRSFELADELLDAAALIEIIGSNPAREAITYFQACHRRHQTRLYYGWRVSDRDPSEFKKWTDDNKRALEEIESAARKVLDVIRLDVGAESHDRTRQAYLASSSFRLSTNSVTSVRHAAD